MKTTILKVLQQHKQSVLAYWNERLSSGVDTSFGATKTLIHSTFEWLGIYEGQVRMNAGDPESWIRPEQAVAIFEEWLSDWRLSEETQELAFTLQKEKQQQRENDNRNKIRLFSDFLLIGDKILNDVIPMMEQLDYNHVDEDLTGDLERLLQSIKRHMGNNRIHLG